MFLFYCHIAAINDASADIHVEPPVATDCVAADSYQNTWNTTFHELSTTILSQSASAIFNQGSLSPKYHGCICTSCANIFIGRTVHHLLTTLIVYVCVAVACIFTIKNSLTIVVNHCGTVYSVPLLAICHNTLQFIVAIFLYNISNIFYTKRESVVFYNISCC